MRCVSCRVRSVFVVNCVAAYVGCLVVICGYAMVLPVFLQSSVSETSGLRCKFITDGGISDVSCKQKRLSDTSSTLSTHCCVHSQSAHDYKQSVFTQTQSSYCSQRTIASAKTVDTHSTNAHCYCTQPACAHTRFQCFAEFVNKFLTTNPNTKMKTLNSS